MIGPGRTSATWTVRSSSDSGFVRTSICICARLSIWNVPVVSACWIEAIDALVLEVDPRQVDHLVARARDLRHAPLDGRQHPEAEQVDLQEAGVRARLLVPVDHLPALHRGRLDRADVDERARRDDHAARVLRDVPREVVRVLDQPHERLPARRVHPRAAERLREVLADVAAVPRVGGARRALDLAGGKPERLSEVADGRAVAVGGERGDERRAVVAVALVDARDQHLADVAREVEVDVGQRLEVLVQEAPERQLLLDRVDVREAGEEADDRRDARPPPPARRQHRARGVRAAHLGGHLARQLEHVAVEQEEPRQAERADHAKLLLEPGARLGVAGAARVALVDQRVA